MNLEDLFYGEFKLQKLYTRDSICNRQCSYKVINLRMTQKKKKNKILLQFSNIKNKESCKYSDQKKHFRYRKKKI